MTPDQLAAKHVLVADDNQAMARVIGFNLQRCGFTTTVTNDGTQAWEKLQRETFDLLITDYQMPEMDGIELCRRVRECRQHDAMGIFMLTAKCFELDTRTMQQELGVTLTMAKPFSLVDLVHAAQQYLGTETHFLPAASK